MRCSRSLSHLKSREGRRVLLGQSGKLAFHGIRAVFLCAMCFVILYPTLYMVSLSFRESRDLLDPTVIWIPKHWTLDNYRAVIETLKYGRLLTEKQRQVMELYHEENLSLAEIAEEFGISRQGVHDTLKKAEHLLIEYEDKLGLVAKLMKSRHAIAEIDGIIDSLTASIEDKEAAAKLQEVKGIINKLEE